MTREEARSLIIKQIKDKKMNFFIRPNGDRPSEIIRAYFLRDIAALEMGADALKDRPQGEWIPVSERLPEDKTYVLTTIKVPNRIAHARSGWYEGGFFHNDNGDTWKATDMEVVAWMPLPRPYQAEREDI